MQEVIRDYLEQAKVGRKQVHKNMALFPLLSDYSLSLDYILLDEALGGGVIGKGVKFTLDSVKGSSLRLIHL